MMRQYRRIKENHADAILFFRLGDFYEMFERDAKEVSALLGLTLTSRAGVPMCGIPYHAAHPYIARLLNAGKKIAICEQLALAPEGKGLAEREVVEVITPGTVVDEAYLDERSNNYLLAISRFRDSISLAAVDLSTGEFTATDFAWTDRDERLKKEVARFRPREIILQESLLEEDEKVSSVVREISGAVVDRYPDWSFDFRSSAEALKKQFGTASLKGFGLSDESPAICSAGIILEYLGETAKSLLPHIRSLSYYTDAEFLGLDEATQRNLEITHNLQDGGGRFTLLEVVDFTKTSMGSRRLRGWLLRPLRDEKTILERQERVTRLYRNQVLLSSLRERLGGVLDLERLSARIAMDKAHAKDLIAIRDSLAQAVTVDALDPDTMRLFTSENARATIVELEELLDRAIDSNPSILLTEGGIIRSGYHPELDELRATRDNSQSVLEAYLDEERKATGISSLRIRYNRIIGYFFEVTKSNLSSVPDRFVRRQSLVGAERFTTDRLAEIESSINSAAERIIELERELFLEVRARVKDNLGTLLDLAESLSRIDCLQSFSQAATVRGWTRPRVTSSTGMKIVAGRHPVVEAHLESSSFVPNDCEIDSENTPFALITGPNMAGKSTYLRQVALITLLAQAGSYVPAQEAEIAIVDRIFCRVGAQDNLARGESTFLVEMNETANILRAATLHSLIIMDEVGRGTGTNDGLSIAWAVSEYLLNVVGAKTLFATHYHELTAIDNPRMKNLSMQVLEKQDDIVFLKRVQAGPSQNSYGIHVARLAGLPEAVLRRAREVLATISGPGLPNAAAAPAQPQQTPLFTPSELVCDEIRALDVNALTPLEAINRLARWKRELDAG